MPRRTRGFAVVILIVFTSWLPAQEQPALPDEFYQLIGKLSVILGEGQVVHQQVLQEHWLIWTDSSLQSLPSEKKKDPSFWWQEGAPKLVAEFVPNDHGICLLVTRPFPPKKFNGHMKRLDMSLRQFVGRYPVDSEFVIEVSVKYGKDFDLKTLGRITELFPPRVEG